MRTLGAAHLLIPVTSSLLAVSLSACIPWPRDTLVRPEGTIVVVDARTGMPLEGASVEVIRYRVGPPPRIVSKRWKKTTDASGRASPFP